MRNMNSSSIVFVFLVWTTLVALTIYHVYKNMSGTSSAISFHLKKVREILDAHP